MSRSPSAAVRDRSPGEPPDGSGSGSRSRPPDDAAEPEIRQVRHRDGAENVHWEEVETQNNEVKEAIRRELRQESRLQRAMARVAHYLTRPWFLITEAIFYITWLFVNSGLIAGVRPVDPYPFAFIMGLASTQGLFISLLVLMYTERNERHNDIREQIVLKQELHAEQEVSKILEMLQEIHEALRIEGTERDKNLKEMIAPVNVHELERGTENTAEDSK
jgi:uncharacterized membrane protein